jgi:para-aminobenzoate synthetase component 1
MDQDLIVPLLPPPDSVESLGRLAGLPFPAFLDANADHHDLGRWSYLTADPVAHISASADQWPEVRETIRNTQSSSDAIYPLPFSGGWIGWFSYEMGRAFDDQPQANAAPGQELPDISLALYDVVIGWDHTTGAAWLISTGIDAEGVRNPERARQRADQFLELLARPSVSTGTHSLRQRVAFSRDFTPGEYKTAVGQVIDHVLSGDIYQANLSQRLVAPFRGSALALHASLRRLAPASLGAYLDHGTHQVLSASPERFLRYDPVTRAIESRPIKGTRPRAADPTTDAGLARELTQSQKDRAENVMIVDLVRNDLSRVAEPASVQVPTLCRLDSHHTVHHLASIVTARLRDDCDGLDALAACFPAGSITGAPKLRAMAILADLEPVRRGVYCGAIGWLGLDGALHLSVAIRTMTITNGHVTIQVGGGITALSDPEDEYQETLAKARAMLQAVEEST